MSKEFSTQNSTQKYSDKLQNDPNYQKGVSFDRSGKGPIPLSEEAVPEKPVTELGDIKNIGDAGEYLANSVSAFAKKHQLIAKGAMAVGAAVAAFPLSGPFATVVGGVVAFASEKVILPALINRANSVEEQSEKYEKYQREHSGLSQKKEPEKEQSVANARDNNHNLDLEHYINENDFKAMMNIMQNYQNHHEESISQRDLDAMKRAVSGLENAMAKQGKPEVNEEAEVTLKLGGNDVTFERKGSQNNFRGYVIDRQDDPQNTTGGRSHG